MKAPLIFSGAVLTAGLVLALPFLAMSYSGGAPSAFSGPEQTCNSCHGVPGDVNTGTGSVTITAPPTYVAGSTVSITVSVDNTTPPVGPTPVQGFMLSARNGDGSLEHVGEFDLEGSTLVRFGSGNDPPDDSLWVTQTSSSNEMTSWTVSWIAPEEAEAPQMVTLYAAGNASNANGVPDFDDFVYTTSHTMNLFTVANEPEAAPTAMSIDAVSPNPFRSSAEISYTLDQPSTVRVVLRDGRGRTVRELENGVKDSGVHRLRISGDDLAPGVYFLTIYGPAGVQTRPLTISN